MLFQALSLVECARKISLDNGLIVNRKLQEQNFGAQIDFVPVLRAVLFKLFTSSESSIEALISSHDSGPSSDILSNCHSTFEALNRAIFIDLGSLNC